ncbi:MAG: hypothetical protein HYS38_05805 [Acidobacteria bacterium]|nr:hypothetical protein [Acidobacteriota bacterium]
MQIPSLVWSALGGASLKRQTPLLLALLLSVTWPACQQETARAPTATAIEVLRTRAVWRDLPPGLLTTLESKLNSTQKTAEFVQLCEGTGILKNNIVGIANDNADDPEFAVALIAVALTSYANTMGDSKKFGDARTGLEFALLLKPRHIPAWYSMALIGVSTGDCSTAVFWADKVLAFKPDPNSSDLWERGLATAITNEGERLAEKILGPGQSANWNELQEDMKTIKDACRK